MNELLNKTKLPLLGLSAMLFALPLTGACSAGDNPTEGAGGEGPAPIPLAPSDEPSQAVQALGGAGNEGAYLVENPFFGQGSYTGVDLSEPCNAAWIWISETAPHGGSRNLVTGDQVVYEGTLWEVTGAGVDSNWALPICTPPGEGYCVEEYAWVEVKACE